MKELLKKWQNDYDKLIEKARTLWDEYGVDLNKPEHKYFAYYHEILAKMQIVRTYLEDLEALQLKLINFIKGDN